MPTHCSRILIVRNDKLGDFMLAWPAFRQVKESLPQARVSALVPPYTAPMARLCPWIDEVVLAPSNSGLAATLRLARELRQGRFDCALTLFSTTRIGLALWLARIPLRVAPATKAAQLFYNRTLRQRRSRSEKPEYQYNLDLAAELLRACGTTPAAPHGPYLAFPAQEIDPLSRELRQRLGIGATQKLIFVHPGSGGSANNLSPEQYAHLCRELHSSSGHGFVITHGPAELPLAERLTVALGELPHCRLAPTGLESLARHLQAADLFISGSTGPLHIAGALDVPTAAFYPRRRSATPLRWQTLNSPQRRLAFAPPSSAEEHDMSSIDVSAAAAEISARFLG